MQTVTTADLEKVLWNENKETGNSFNTSLEIPFWERDNLIDSIQTKLLKPAELRKTYIANKLEHQNSKRIILPSIGRKDTDPRIAIEILNEGLEKFLDCSKKEDRMLTRGDQKIMGLALRLKREHPDTYRNIYITIHDLHFRKSFMHAVLVRYEIDSTDKTFEFLELLADALCIALMFEFITYIEKNKENTRDQLLTNPSLVSKNLNQFIYKQSKDEIFLKNIEVLETFEIVLSRYTTVRTSNWDLRTGTFKKSLPFAFTFNCTHYVPLLTELLFHQFSFQQRFLYLLKDGYFNCMFLPCHVRVSE